MPLNLLEGALGGIGLFLLGMRYMSNGIRTVADERIRSVFSLLTSNRFFSMLFGIALSVSLNSVSAAVIFSIGLLNGGVLNSFQVLSVLGGVLVGAALSLHLPLIPYSLVATPLVFVGVVLKFFARRRKASNAGDLLLGAGLLFLGLSLLESSFQPFETHPFYNYFNGAFFNNPLLATLFGSMISCFVHSSSSLATVVTSLVSNYDVSAEIASVMMLGGLIGVSFIAALAAIGGTSASRRIAAAFFSVNLIAVLILIFSLHYLLDMDFIRGIVEKISGPEPDDHRLMAWIYTFTAVLAAFLSIVFSGLAARIIGATEFNAVNGVKPQPCAGYLDPRILNTPTIAIEQARKEIVRMMSVVSYMYADTRELLFDYDARRTGTIRQHEQVLDSLNHEITAFLAALASSGNSAEIGYTIPGLLQNVTDLEHIGDRCEDILDCILARKEGSILFSEDAMDDLKRLAQEVSANVAALELSFPGSENPPDIRQLKSTARQAFSEVKARHFVRISSGECTSRAAILYNDIATAFERISELCWNIMQVQSRKLK
jgi:phosphate:Na+ symporter